MSVSQLIPHQSSELPNPQPSSSVLLQYENTLAPSLIDSGNNDSDRNTRSAVSRRAVWKYFNKKKIDGVAKAVCKYFNKKVKGDLGSGTTKKHNKKAKESTSDSKEDHPEICYYHSKNETTKTEHANTMPGVDKRAKKEFAYNFNHETTKAEHANTTPKLDETAKHKAKKEFACNVNHETTKKEKANAPRRRRVHETSKHRAKKEFTYNSNYEQKTEHENTMPIVNDRAQPRKKHKDELGPDMVELGCDIFIKILCSDT